MSWKLRVKVPRGHRFFEDAKGDLYVADDSGATPDQTDDGPIKLDPSRPVRLLKDHSDPRFYFWFPAFRRTGEACSVVEYWPSGLVAVETLGLKLTADDPAHADCFRRTAALLGVIP